jgi:hypothetical protein
MLGCPSFSQAIRRADFLAAGDRREGESNRCGLRRARRLDFRDVARPRDGRRDGRVRQRKLQGGGTNLKLLQYPIPPALWADLRAEKLLHPDAPTPG